MKTFLLPLCLLGVLLVGAVPNAAVSKGGVVGPYNATFHKNAWFSSLLDENAPKYAVLRSSTDLENLVQNVMNNFRADTATVPAGYWEETEQQIRQFYSRYTPEFFTKKDLIIALVDQGSGSVRYELTGLSLENGLLTIDVARHSPMVQTMDFVSWLVFLELDKGNVIDNVNVVLE